MSDEDRLGRAMACAGDSVDGDAERVMAAVADRLGIGPEHRRIGRFDVEQRLGAGAMGVVYLARDADLERPVALKLLRATRKGEVARARLCREAKALACLRHPNVVAVHELGVYEDQVFVAMEYVAGCNLREWLAVRRRPVPELVARFVDAARGLAAAHDAGIVHRDFKPANVLVGDDGRTQVADFGLAARTFEAPSDTVEAYDERSSMSSLTRTGTVVGTPAYMAPEVLRGQTATPASDQFSFCVALYEALWGVRPFGAESFGGLLAEIERGARVEDRSRPVPRAVKTVLRRGLDPDPARRWPDMRTLVKALAWRPGRRRAALAAAGLIAVGSSLGAVATQTDPCGQAGERFAGTWNAERRAELRRAFDRSQLPDAPAIARIVEANVDGFAQAWVAGARDACEASRVRGEQSSAAHDLRTQCLERRRAELEAVLESLAGGGERAIRRAASATSRLTPVAICDDLAMLSAVDPLPDDPSIRAEVIGARRGLSRVRGLLAAGQLGEASAALADVPTSAAAHSAALAAELAHARAVEAIVRGDPVRALASFSEAFSEALRGDATRVAVEAAVTAILVASQIGDAEEARRWVWLADPLVSRFADDAALQSGYRWHVGLVEYIEEDYEAALASFSRAERIASTSTRWTEERVASLQQMQGLALRELGEEERALELLLAADATLVRAYGEESPTRASLTNSLGNAFRDAGRFERAVAHYQRSIQLYDLPPLGPNPMAGHPLNNLGRLRAMRGDHVRAVALFDRALARLEPALGLDHPDVIDIRRERERALTQVHGADPRSEDAIAVGQGGAVFDARAEGDHQRE